MSSVLAGAIQELLTRSESHPALGWQGLWRIYGQSRICHCFYMLQSWWRPDFRMSAFSLRAVANSTANWLSWLRHSASEIASSSPRAKVELSTISLACQLGASHR